MYEQKEKSKENTTPTGRQESRAVVNSVVQNKSDIRQDFMLLDNRSEGKIQAKLKEAMNSKSQAMQQQQKIHKIAYNEKMINKQNYSISPTSSISIQRCPKKKKTLVNIDSYAPGLVKKHGVEMIKQVVDDEDLEVRGHHSQDSSAKMNRATEDDLSRLKDALNSRVSRKKKPIREQSKLTNYEKALRQAKTTYYGNQDGFEEYLKSREMTFPEDELDSLYGALLDI